MKKLTLLITLAAMANISSAEENSINTLDTDKDGKISLQEAAADEKLAAIFTELDTDKDGFLSVQELAKKDKN